ncbi:MAG: hypothetical protein CM1200mP20_02030 [Pseudomonadota bacterium]|nr:MAG: hypothetical protein CM1200mP20_02030 [Pseudomonadota bacterium]
MNITLYESGTSRSARCRWTLLEAGIAFESVPGPNSSAVTRSRRCARSANCRSPGIDGRPIFESAAICTYIADHAPEADLIAKPGTWARGQHDQWTSFVLTEMEAWLGTPRSTATCCPKHDGSMPGSNRMP